MKKSVLSIALLAPALLFLPSCDWFSTENKQESPSKTAESVKMAEKQEAIPANVKKEDILLTIKGKPAITIKQFEEYVTEITKAQPQLKQLMMFMPDAEYELFKSMENEMVLQHWIKDNNITQRSDYQRDLKLGQDYLERQLAIKYFQEEYPKKVRLEVTDADARKIYDERKDTTPELVISRGGVNAQGVMFDKEADAQAFLAKVKELGNFDKAAQEQHVATVKAFKQVNQQSFDVDAPIRDALLAMKSFPASEMIKVKDKFWVVQATNKEETTYVPFDQVKDMIKQQLKMQKLFTEELEKLKKGMDITEHKDYFERKKKAQEEELEKVKKEHEAMQEKEAKPKMQAPGAVKAPAKNNAQGQKSMPMPPAPKPATKGL